MPRHLLTAILLLAAVVPAMGHAPDGLRYNCFRGKYPPRPVDGWELGISGGLCNISGDVPSLLLWNGGGWGLGAHLRKSLGYLVSLRIDYNYGIAKGFSFQPASGYARNPAWNGGVGTGPAANPANADYMGGPVFYNYRTEMHQLNLDLQFSFGNMLFHRAQARINPYVFGGLALNAYQSWINAADAAYRRYDFDAIAAKYPQGVKHGDRRQLKRDLQSLLDDSYETAAETDRQIRRPTIFGTKTPGFSGTAGAGMQFRISRRVNLSLEDRISFSPTTNEDLLDGQRWDPNSVNTGIRSQSKDGINYLSLGINCNLGGRTEPQFWRNPLDYPYGELAAPKYMNRPEQILPDADGDGITDAFDRCGGTVPGIGVNAHGCPVDTDGDGVPDVDDKQPITATECQPVDDQGVGRCPCARELACGAWFVMRGAIVFNSGSRRITPAMVPVLADLANRMMANPTGAVVIIAREGGCKSRRDLSYERLEALIEYMSEQLHIDRSRFLPRLDNSVPANTIMFRNTDRGEEAPVSVPVYMR